MDAAVSRICVEFRTQFSPVNQEFFSGLKHYRPFCFISAALLLAICLPTMALAQSGSSASLADSARTALRRHDYADALTLAQRSSDQGDPAGSVLLGFIYARGLGVSKDYAKAIKLYRAAAERGDADGQTKLGLMYNQGTGVPEDDAQAVAWYRKAAEQGNAAAEHLLGLAYLGGEGVPKDYSQAMAWFRKAADQGSAESQLFIGEMYEIGQGVHRDYFQAFAWYRKAADQGLDEAQKKISSLRQDLKTVIPGPLAFRCFLNGALPGPDNASYARYLDCVASNLKRLGAELR